MTFLTLIMLIVGVLLFFAGVAADDWVVQTIGWALFLVGLFPFLAVFF